jgi:hypothetical protein
MAAWQHDSVCGTLIAQLTSVIILVPEPLSDGCDCESAEGTDQGLIISPSALCAKDLMSAWRAEELFWPYSASQAGGCDCVFRRREELDLIGFVGCAAELPVAAQEVLRARQSCARIDVMQLVWK